MSTTTTETAAATATKSAPFDRAAFDPVPSWRRLEAVALAAGRAPAGAAVGVPVGEKGAVPRALGLDRAALASFGFEGKPGQTLVVPRAGDGPAVAIGTGSGLTTAQLRDAAAAFARVTSKFGVLATSIHEAATESAAAAQAVVEGVLLARYRFDPLKHGNGDIPGLSSLTLISAPAKAGTLQAGIDRGRATAGAATLARDLANTPPSHLTATRIAHLAAEIAAASGLGIEVFGPAELLELGCGGLLGVNAGSTEEPRLIKLTYTPKRKKTGAAKLAMVGKGIMYDSGGISLKPSDASHASMKMDMSGAAAVLSSMSTLSALNCPNEVVGFMMCTDNMPSGSAMKLGDVLHIHGGKTVEVHNTDAEGRLVLADGLALATEEQPDAIVDIATLTGACGVALGPAYAGLLGNNQDIVDQVKAASARTDEPVWQLPLERTRYRKLLDSDVADMKNVGGPQGGTITAAIFLSEFVGDTPWAHLDIAPPMRVDADDSWRTKGATGVGTRLLIELALTFSAGTLTKPA